VDLLQRADGTGDLPLKVEGTQRIGYAGLWPHARPWHYQMPQPMLRCVPNAESVAALVARTCLAANPGSQIGTIEPAPIEQVANRPQTGFNEVRRAESATA
jgi:hypothetical protein